MDISTIQLNKWMSYLDNNKSLTELSIPGTHDSATYNTSSSLSKCQTYSISDQLEIGVRFLDLRVRYDSGSLKMYHGIDNLGGLTFQDVMTTVKTFLQNNPSEIVLYRFMREDSQQLLPDNTNNDDFFIAQLQTELSNVGLTWYDTSTVSDLKLGTNRGRAIIIEYNSKNTNPGFNMAAYAVRTSPFNSGWSNSDFLTSQISDKYQDLLTNGIPKFANSKFSRLELNAVGGTVVLGVTIPNPQAFVQAFAPVYYKNLLQYCRKGPNYLWFIDFEEIFAGTGIFYQEIIFKNFAMTIPTNLKLILSGTAPTTTELELGQMAIGKIGGNQYLFMNTDNTITTININSLVTTTQLNTELGNLQGVAPLI